MRTVDDDVFEVVDLLRSAVLEELEVRGGQILNGRAVFRREDVDAHHVRPAAEAWLLRRLGWRRSGLRLRENGDQREAGDPANVGHGHLTNAEAWRSQSTTPAGVCVS